MHNDIRTFYNQSHLKKISRRGYYDEKFEFYKEHLEKIAISKKKLRILDIACNDGGMTEKFLPYGEVIGIDINKDSIKSCKQKGLNCLLASVEELDKNYNSYFDVVVAGDIIEHVFNTDTFLENVHRVLNKNGKLLLTTANVASFGRRLMMLVGKNPFLEYSLQFPSKEYNVGHIRYYTVADMRLQTQNLGFKNVSIYGDKINVIPGISLPRSIAKNFPTISRYMHVYAEKK